MINFDTIKATVKALRRQAIKVRAPELIALAPQNDPFFCGSPSQRRDADWFAEVFEKVAVPGAHLRRIHYRILDLSEEERRLPLRLSTKLTQADGTKKITEFEYYENFDRCWEWLAAAAKSARWLNLVPIDAFVDNRAKESSFSFYTHWLKPGNFEYFDPTPRFEVTSGMFDEFSEYYIPDLPELPDLPAELEELPRLSAKGYTSAQQRYHIEIWVEKAEGEDVFLPLCQKYNVNFVPGVGEMSITTTHRFCERVRRAERPAKLLYISDFDPSGHNMPVAVARKLEWFCRNHDYGDLDITLEPLMLTERQVIEYNLPSAPVKDTDGRKTEWEARFGGAVELNAMFARDERIIDARRLVEEKILKYYDDKLLQKNREAKAELEAALDEARDEVIDRNTDDWNQLEADYEQLLNDWDQTREEFAALTAPFREKIEAYHEKLSDIKLRGRDLQKIVTDELESVEIDPETDYPLVEANEAGINGELFHSSRSYWEQLAFYYRHKNIDTEWLDYLVEATL